MTPGSRTPEAIANTIRMKRLQFAGVFVIVEGDTDARFYERFTDNSSCTIQIAGNKQNAIKVLGILDADSCTGVLAIVDTDFDVLEGRQTPSGNLLLTDFHDLECLLFASPALDKVLTEFVSEEKFEHFSNLRQIIVEAAAPVGCLRWDSLKNNWGLKFEGLDYKKFLHAKTLIVDHTSLVKALRKHSQRLQLPESELLRSIATILAQDHPPLHLCCGHDLIAVLSFSLLKTIGTYDSKEVKPEVLERSLRLAYESAYFATTELCQQIRGWEQANAPYKVLHQDGGVK